MLRLNPTPPKKKKVDKLDKKPTEYEKKLYGNILDKKHPFRKIKLNKKKNVEDIFIKKKKSK